MTFEKPNLLERWMESVCKNPILKSLSSTCSDISDMANDRDSKSPDRSKRIASAPAAASNMINNIANWRPIPSMVAWFNQAKSSLEQSIVEQDDGAQKNALDNIKTYFE